MGYDKPRLPAQENDIVHLRIYVLQKYLCPRPLNPENPGILHVLH